MGIYNYTPPADIFDTCWLNLFSRYLHKFRFQKHFLCKMLKDSKRFKAKMRLKELSFRDKTNPVLKNIEVAGILGEIHPIAAGVYNTAYFVIINQKKQVKTEPTELISSGSGILMRKKMSQSATRSQNILTESS